MLEFKRRLADLHYHFILSILEKIPNNNRSDLNHKISHPYVHTLTILQSYIALSKFEKV